jgi:hypothetical protein
MNVKPILNTFKWIAVAGIVFSIFCLAANGAGDRPESFRMYILCSTILLSFVLLSLALIHKKEDN